MLSVVLLLKVPYRDNSFSLILHLAILSIIMELSTAEMRQNKYPEASKNHADSFKVKASKQEEPSQICLYLQIVCLKDIMLLHHMQGLQINAKRSGKVKD